MFHDPLVGLAAILLLGVGAQWLAWRMKLPSILLLFLFGFLAGPVSGMVLERPLIDPDALFGQDMLFAFVSVSVAVLLFEGGMSLKLAELKGMGGVIVGLMTVGAALTWLAASAAAHWLLGLDWGLAILLGAVLVVTGPTVIGPMLRQIRPSGSVGPILKWEGILIDPLGATLAVLVFEVLAHGGDQGLSGAAVLPLVKTAVVGVVLGFAAAGLVILMLRRYWVPDYLVNPFILMVLVLAFAVSHLLQHESGLLTVTVMGMVLANQKRVTVTHVTEFKENLVVLLIAVLFIVLAARLKWEDVRGLSLGSVAFLAVMILLVRPGAVMASTVLSSLTWQEKAFLSAMAPRGIVAAAVSSLFALRLVGQGIVQAEQLVPATFLIIVGTITVYGLGAPPFGRWLGVARAHPQGALIVGANPLARAIGEALKKNGFDVVLTDTNRENTRRARMAGMRTYTGSVASPYALDEIDLSGIGRVLAMTPNDDANSLAVVSLMTTFGRKEVYQVSPPSRSENGGSSDADHAHKHHGRMLFGSGLTYEDLFDRILDGAAVRATKITDEFTYDDFKAMYGDAALPLGVVHSGDELTIFTSDKPAQAESGQTLLSLLTPTDEDEGPA